MTVPGPHHHERAGREHPGHGVDRIEIRLLGPLRVRRADGGLVDPHAWRTRKTADLLMLLALHAGEVVPSERLVEALWPDVEEAKGRASLRTALSHLRKALQADPFGRDRRGPVLEGVWVDALVYRSLAEQGGRAADEGRDPDVVAAAREAESLWLTELAPEADGSWAEAPRQQWAVLRRDLLGRAGAAALALGRPREALELGERLLELDPFQEGACRTVMTAAAALGEVDRALQAYTALTTRLSDELGADPSPQTRAVHLHVLRADVSSGRTTPFVGRAAEVAALAEQLNASGAGQPSGSGLDGGGRLLLVHGEDGVGTTAVVEAAVALAQERAPDLRAARLTGDDLQDGLAATRARLLVVDRLDRAAPSAVAALDVRLSGGAVVVATCPSTALTGASPLTDGLVQAEAGGLVWRLRLAPLGEQALADLAQDVLAGQPGPELVATLLRASRGHPGRAVALLEQWLTRGEVVAMGTGLALVPQSACGGAPGGAAARQALALLLRQVDDASLDVLEAAAVLGAQADEEHLVLTTQRPGPEVARAVRHLVDLSVLQEAGDAVVVRDPLLRLALLEWVRPSVRRELHRRAAEHVDLPAAAEAAHWLAAGEPGLAAAAELAAAEHLASTGRLEEATTRLRGLLAAGAEVDPELRLRLAERLGDYLAQHGAAIEAGGVYEAAAAEAQEQGLDGTARLATKALAPLGRPVLGRPLHGSGHEQATPDDLDLEEAVVGPRAGRLLLSLAEELPAPSAAGGEDAEHELRVRVEAAKRRGDHAAAVETQLELCALVYTPQRRLAELARLTGEARVLAPDEELRGRALLVAAEPEILLGGAERWASLLLEAVTDVRGGGGLATGLPPGRLLALAMHDLGQDGSVGIPSRGAGWVVAHVLLERGDVPAAAQALARPSEGGPALAVVLDVLTRGRVLLAQGAVAEGTDHLRQALDLAVGTGVGLLVPEIAGRLAAEEAVTDVDAAIERLELAELALGEVALPRERVALLLARAAVRAERRGPAAAVEVARTAARLATRAGLVHLAVEAQSVADHHARAARHVGLVGGWSVDVDGQPVPTGPHAVPSPPASLPASLPASGAGHAEPAPLTREAPEHLAHPGAGAGSAGAGHAGAGHSGAGHSGAGHAGPGSVGPPGGAQAPGTRTGPPPQLAARDAVRPRTPWSTETGPVGAATPGAEPCPSGPCGLATCAEAEPGTDALVEGRACATAVDRRQGWSLPLPRGAQDRRGVRH